MSEQSEETIFQSKNKSRKFSLNKGVVYPDQFSDSIGSDYPDSIYLDPDFMSDPDLDLGRQNGSQKMKKKTCGNNLDEGAVESLPESLEVLPGLLEEIRILHLLKKFFSSILGIQ